MIFMVLSTHAELASATARGRSYCETGLLKILHMHNKINIPGIIYYAYLFIGLVFHICIILLPFLRKCYATEFSAVLSIFENGSVLFTFAFTRLNLYELLVCPIIIHVRKGTLVLYFLSMCEIAI